MVTAATTAAAAKVVSFPRKCKHANELGHFLLRRECNDQRTACCLERPSNEADDRSNQEIELLTDAGVHPVALGRRIDLDAKEDGIGGDRQSSNRGDYKNGYRPEDNPFGPEPVVEADRQ